MEPATMSMLASVAPSATGLISEVGNWIATERNNRKNREFAVERYEAEKADNLKQWHLQNEYNSPSAQMERLQLAGLNPNLVYGKGADNLAGNINRTSGQVPMGNAPRVDLSRPFSDYQNFALRKAQTDNQLVQNTVIAQEAALKAAQTASIVQNTAKSQFDLDLAKELRKISADVAGEQLRKLQYDNVFNIERTEQLVAMKESNIQMAAEKVMSERANRANTEAERNRINAQIQQIKSSTVLQDLDAELKKNGINPNDPIYLRVLGRILGNAGSLGDIYNNIKSYIK